MTAIALLPMVASEYVRLNHSVGNPYEHEH